MLRETAQEKGKEGKRRGEKATRRAAAREQARRRSAAGLGSAPPTGIRRQTEKMPRLPQTAGGAGAL